MPLKFSSKTSVYTYLCILSENPPCYYFVTHEVNINDVSRKEILRMITSTNAKSGQWAVQNIGRDIGSIMLEEY